MKNVLRRVFLTYLQPRTRREVEGVLDDLSVPGVPEEEGISKAKYIDARLSLVADTEANAVAERFLETCSNMLSPADRFELQEHLWTRTSTFEVNRRTRFKLARAIEGLPLFLRPAAFLDMIRRDWDRSSVTDLFFGDARQELVDLIERHVIRNPGDWTVDDLFERLGAYNASSPRFALLIESLASSTLRPDEESQRRFAAACNSVLTTHGLELREIEDGGFPRYRLTPIGKARRSPKNLIFASPHKPDLRFRDAVDNDVQIVTNAEKVLVYDRPISSKGLVWNELQLWWAELKKLDFAAAKSSLYERLRASLPDNSPPQQLLFDAYHRHFRGLVPRLPALLPEVWLHWDPKTVRERGCHALTRFRMDFLLLLPNETRIVVEVDGQQHYSNRDGSAAPASYAKMMAADRDLRLAGYELFRFGAAELQADSALQVVGDFFDRLYTRYQLL